MKTTCSPQKSDHTGSALALTMIMTAIALAILAGALTWSTNTTRLTHRSIQYNRSVMAAEAATEKVLSHITRDYLNGGEKGVQDNLASYRQLVPKASDSTFWDQWEFNDAAGTTDQSFVERRASDVYVVLNSTYAGLRGFVTTYSVVSNARETAALQTVVAGVLQEVQLARIPIFQFAMYSSSYMEIGCGQPFTITGRVHSNQELYVEPVSDLTFQSDVTAVGDILYARHPLDPRVPPYGTVVYQGRKDAHVAAMTLPIGTTNTPTAIREIIQPPPSGENPNSPLGRLRYYNLSDMLLVVSDTEIRATSGGFNGFATAIPASELTNFVVGPALVLLQQNLSGGNKMEIKQNEKGAQSFRHGSAGGPAYSVSKVKLRLSRKSGAPNNDLNFSIGTGINSAPLAGSSFAITMASITNTSDGSSFQDYEIAYVTPVGPFTAGTTYYLNLDNAPNGKEVWVEYSGSSTYASGTYYKGGSDDSKDMRFQIYSSTNLSFYDAREEKSILPIDINIGGLKAWSETNSTLRVALGSKDVSSVYVLDRRTMTGTNLGAVRVVNGLQLPSRGLTVATARPLYVLGHYNQTNLANFGTTNTSTTRPASLVGDAVTILSPNWKDTNSTRAVGSRLAVPTTVNAAILTGVVETTLGQYSGGMENFPRFLETWGSANPLTYNGSMVKMFPSLYATNVYGKANVYTPPKRDWAYDVNFNDATKLPPLTPSLMKVFRGQWATVAPNSKVAVAEYEK